MTDTTAPLRIGVDIGGTFTDVVMMRGNALVRHKLPSTPHDPSVAFLDGIDGLGVSLADVDLVAHSTTVATNAAITGGGARTLLVTTEGFRDTLLMRRTNRADQFNLWWKPPAPLIERRHIFEAPERLDAHGNVRRALEPAQAEALAAQLAELQPEAVAIVFLHAFVNPEHELTMLQAVRAACPDAYVCASHEVLSEILEYERTSTTVLNAMVGPVVRGYVARAGAALSDRGYAGDLLISSSSGGMMTPEVTAALPAKTMMSGPAAGVVAASSVARAAGFDHAISFEMGGTSLDVGLIEDGEVRRGQAWNVAFETPVRLPVVDVSSIGTGGGTIAWIDRGGGLRSGPLSAGADPGPVCYGRGGTQPTNTDAQVVLGRLDPERFLGGGMRLDLDLAVEAMRTSLAEPLGLSPVEAAAGVLTVAENSMVEALRLSTVHRGRDPRDFVLVAGGGAGPLFAPGVARLMNIPTVIVPPWPGLASAVGLLMMEIRHETSRSLLAPLRELKDSQIVGALRALGDQVVEELEQDGVDVATATLTYEAEVRYFGTSHALTIPLEESGASAEALRTRFLEQHEREYGYTVPPEVAEVELATLRAAAVVATDSLELEAQPLTHEGEAAPVSARREVYYADSGWVEVPVHDRDALRGGMVVTGPAIVEQTDTTTVLLAGMRATVDAYGNLIIDVSVED
ncbi:MAG TPA: hydantoinase/oxoprolinase family protein [Capillimicrobium sp.]|nr:hydantoinase/oxoprolinase family protein [Capillimicrobium sp.]